LLVEESLTNLLVKKKMMGEKGGVKGLIQQSRKHDTTLNMSPMSFSSCFGVVWKQL
jgi:hypothetical protein